MQRDLDTLATAGVEGPDLLIHLRRMYLVPEVNHKESIKKKFKGLKRGGASNLLKAMQVYQRVLTEVNNAHYFPDEEQCTSTFRQIATSEEWDKIYHRVAEKMLDADEGADLNKMKFTDIWKQAIILANSQAATQGGSSASKPSSSSAHAERSSEKQGGWKKALARGKSPKRRELDSQSAQSDRGDRSDLESQRKCGRCGGKWHERMKDCTALGVQCDKYNQKGHLPSMCRNPKKGRSEKAGNAAVKRRERAQSSDSNSWSF
uniref:Uncharacterized protein n=1 Tax=Chromera velia CCMP2878 TaxID=1169474 RepID=A0A0G4H113_9ALVE|eukprot:Cvel_5514.t1-p1 / transcript=Cvel_5514.t1 / gene=Cvel_5514 / organism=Chromera_velia_CCMP2878 / gene_product=hypothetical protein / transcript_product=hypothetical protein / location=Cvel_scaffold258:56417-57199(+) / protein_length=261 / sequence_SO=supercontig / SO=protein_coding / is_pseudo=false